MKNCEIRNLIKRKRLFHWEVAQELGISEPTFTRWLRVELEGEKRERVISAIARLGTEVE